MGNCMTNTGDAINQEDDHSHHTNTSIHHFETNNTHNDEHNEDNNKIKTIMANINIDINVFKDNKTVKKCDKHNDNPIEACEAVKRLVLTLKYYSSLDLITNTEDQNTFAHFITNIYKI
eukprot:342627_1